MEKTTIQVNQGTLERLRLLRRYERESYDEVLNILLDESEEELTKDEIEQIQEGLEQVKRGEVYPIEDVAKELGIRLKDV
jgi:predicted transcriptional regulator